MKRIITLLVYAQSFEAQIGNEILQLQKLVVSICVQKNRTGVSAQGRQMMTGRILKM